MAVGPRKTETSILAHTYNPSTCMVDTRGSVVQGRPQLHSEKSAWDI